MEFAENFECEGLLVFDLDGALNFLALRFFEVELAGEFCGSGVDDVLDFGVDEGFDFLRGEMFGVLGFGLLFRVRA